MAKFEINLTNSKPDHEIWQWLEQNLQKTLNKRVRSEKITLSPNSNNKTIEFKGKTVKGLLTLKNKTTNISMEIPLLYRAFAPIIKSEIEKIFSEM